MADRIVITGAPGSGKTEFLHRLRNLEPTRGFMFFEELARQILSEDPSLRQHRNEFHMRIYREQVTREREAGERSFVTDRGTVDAFAFHPETLDHVGSTIAREYTRYSAVIQLGSAAILGEPYYKRDAIRTESVDDALTIEQALRDVWSGHPAYRFVEANCSYDTKFSRFVKTLCQCLEQKTDAPLVTSPGRDDTMNTMNQQRGI